MDHFENLLELIEIEREAEREENKRELDRYPLQVREALGKTVTRLSVIGDDIGVGGLPLVVLSRSSGTDKDAARAELAPFHAMNQGDNVRLNFPAGSPIESMDGTLYEVREFQATVALNAPPPDDWPSGRYQLDLLGSDATYKRMRQALGLVRRSEKSDLVRLREIFMGGKPAAADRDNIPDEIFNSNLNSYQVDAVKKCVAASDVALVHGPPGTGKTTVLIEVIRQTVKRGGRVLASAPSNIAVDNMVEKLLPANLRIVRMGHPARTLESLRHVTLSAQEEAQPIKEEIERMQDERRRLLTQLRRKENRGMGLDYNERREILAQVDALAKQAKDYEFSVRRQIIKDAQVVLCTHGGTGGMLARQKFDLVVMDEASQATEPLSWIPITLAKKVVFAGDSNQLPPTIYSKEAAERGLSMTLFEQIKKNTSQDFQTLLRVQYRMHEKIMKFSSDQFYEGKLIADESVRDHVAADLPGVEKTPLTQAPVSYIDTAGSGFDETWNELLESRENDGEAKLVFKVFGELMKLGVQPNQVAIITPYVAQVKKLRLMMNAYPIEIGSIDSFQGREKEVIILSLVRSNDSGEVGFLSDTRRMNVGMTRARRLLIVIGDSATIGRHPFYSQFIDYIDSLDAHDTAWSWPDL